MSATSPRSTDNDQTAEEQKACPHCGKSYRTLIKRQYGVRLEGTMTQSVPMGSRWRCMSCGKSYVTEAE